MLLKFGIRIKEWVKFPFCPRRVGKGVSDRKATKKPKKLALKTNNFEPPPKKNLKNLFKNKFTRDIMQLFSADTKIFFF
jgi:hypothetical protein